MGMPTWLRNSGIGLHWSLLGFRGAVDIHPFRWSRWLRFPKQNILGGQLQVAIGPVQFYQCLDPKWVSSYGFELAVTLTPSPVEVYLRNKRWKERRREGENREKHALKGVSQGEVQTEEVRS